MIPPTTRKELLEELDSGDGLYYIAQELGFACPGIVKEWPNIIKHPTNKRGRLIKRRMPKDGEPR